MLLSVFPQLFVISNSACQRVIKKRQIACLLLFWKEYLLRKGDLSFFENEFF